MSTHSPRMAGKKDDEAQKARAQRLRRQIAGVKAGVVKPPASPREFIEEKMRERTPAKRKAVRKAR